MRLRSIVSMVVVVAAIFAGACGGDGDRADDNTTSTVNEADRDQGDRDQTDRDQTGTAEDGGDEGPGNGESEPTEDATPGEPLDDDEFAAVVEQVRSDLAAAGPDPCKLVQSQGVDLVPEPVGPAQSRMTVELFADMMGSMADALDANGKGESAAALRDAAEQVVAEGEAAGYSEQFMTETPAALSDEAVARAQTDFMALAQSCQGPADASG